MSEFEMVATEALDLSGVDFDPATNPYTALFADPAVATWRPAKPGDTPGQCLPEADDPTPTTGPPYEDQRPAGCTCHWREYTDVGDTRYAPPEGCRVHTPWAFPGYSLTAEAAP